MENLHASSSTISLILFLFLAQTGHSQSDFDPFTNCTITRDTYAPNSTFHQNLKVVLSNLTLAASITNSSFYNSSYGQNRDTVHGLYLCRGDLTPEDCLSCIVNITQSIILDCPNKRESISWDKRCMLRYANRNIFSKEEESPEYSTMLGPASFAVRNETLLPPPPVLPTFNRTKVVYDLINETAFGNYSSPVKTKFYATREDNMTGSWIPDVLYSLAQCTPDISPQLCHKCLTQAYDFLSCCPDVLQAETFFPSCHFRIDVSKFFHTKKETHSASPPPLPASSPAPAATGLPPPSALLNRRQQERSVIPVAVGISLGLAMLLLFGFCFYARKWSVKPSSNEVTQIINMESLQYDISTVRTATNNFSADNKLGQGVFGGVYKGRLQTGQDIAVKRLSINLKQGIQEFKTEVFLLAKLQHRNLVRLLGFCVTEEVKLLIYEYLPSSTLDQLLFDREEGSSLNWETRYKIIDGIAKGLLYLHEDSQYKIIHQDLRPSNILLDKDMTPKISEFGTAKLFEEGHIQGISNTIVGTHGYMAPEYIRNGQLSIKSDVYSFGVLVLEIVSGRRIRDGFIHTPEHEENLIQYAMRLWNAKEPLVFVDPTLHCKFSEEEAMQCIHIGLSCIQEDADKRPTMEWTVSMFNSYSDNIPQPSQGGYFNSDIVVSSGEPDQPIPYSGTEDITAMTGR